MNATSTPASCCSPGDAISTNEIATSARVPLFVLFVGAAIWLVIASVLGLIATLKFHSTGFLAGTEELTYGRVYPAANNAFLYGFALQAGLGAALWLLAQIGQTKIVQPWVAAFGGKLWNLGVLLGVLAILGGESTGFENLEMPHYAAWFLWLAMIVIGFCALFTVHARRERSLEPSQWFLIAALFWLPWIFSTARLTLIWWPVRGIAQAVVDWWFSANLNYVWLALVGLATIFYLQPFLLNRKLHSRHLAVFTFWTLILFASWSGIPSSAPVPAWMPALSTVATLLTVIPALAVAVNIFKTSCGQKCEEKNSAAFLFIAFGALAFVAVGIARAFNALPPASAVTNFTWFTIALAKLNTYGFFAMAMFGLIYYAVPRVTSIEWPQPKLIRAHFWLAAIGILLFVLPLAIGGIVQGMKLNDPQVAFADVTKSALMPLRVSTLGEVLLLLGHLMLVVNITVLSVQYYKKYFLPTLIDMSVVPAAEVKR
jgi:cytochrome c oxidase cbb3-type subunit 1